MLDFQRSIIDVCCGFVVINKDGYVAMVHQTAREYLLNGVDRPFHIESNAAHKQVFLSCMSCLMAVVFVQGLIANSKLSSFLTRLLLGLYI